MYLYCVFVKWQELNLSFTCVNGVFQVIWEGLINIDECRPHALFQSIYQLCTILHNRDCRRPFTASSSSSSNKQFWIAIESMVKKSQVMAEFERRQGRAQLLMTRMPHVVPLHDRMLLFRKFVQKVNMFYLALFYIVLELKQLKLI